MAKTYVTSKSGLKVDTKSAAGQRLLASQGSSSKSSTSSSSSSSGSSGKRVMKIGTDGIARYSDGSTNDNVQAYIDWNYGTNGGNSDYRNSNGSSAYQSEYDRLLGLKVGDSVWGSSGGSSGSYSSYLERAQREAQNAINARTDAAVKQVAAQQSGINQAASSAAQQAYINRELSARDMGQQLAAIGLSGGASESAVLGLNTGYENSRNSIVQNRDNAIQENINQQNQIRASGDASLAEAENQYYMQLAQQQQQLEQYERQRADQLNDIQSERDYQAKLAAQKAGKSTATKNYFDEYMKLYAATGDDKYRQLAEQSIGVTGAPVASGGSGSYSNSAADSWTPSGKEAYIKALAAKGLTNAQITAEINRMGW